MKLWLAFFLLFLNQGARADVDLGLGLTSTLGRFVPALSGAYVTDRWAISASSTGVQTTIYYESAYTLAGYKMWNAGNFWWGPLSAGFGGGLAYSQRGYRNGPNAVTHNDSDFNLGPAFRIHWEFLSSAYLNFDAIWGLGVPAIELAGQDSVIFSLGWRL